MSNIEVGEYVRTKNGYIIKYKDNINTNIFSCDDALYVENSLFPDEEEIVNHSKNIIDLIEVGDYVNGEKVLLKNEGYIKVGTGRDYIVVNNEKFIKSIVTKEMYKSVEYRVGE